MSAEAEEYGEWRVTYADDIRGGMVSHKHHYNPPGGTHVPLVFAVDEDGRCRKCGKLCPKGVLFRARTSQLEGLNAD